MNFFHSRLRTRDFDQRGINMVDLMMWLVIASLLLAAALQGIGYYRQSADLYTMKSDAMHAGETVGAKASQNGGQFTAQTVVDGVTESAKSQNVTITPDAGASDSAGYVLRATHPEVTDKDVLFLSNQRGTYPPGVNVVPKGTVIAPDGSTSIAAPSGGGGGTSATFTPISASASSSPVVTRLLNSNLVMFSSPLVLAGDAAYANGDNTTGDAMYNQFNATPAGVESAAASTVEANIESWYLLHRSDAGIPALFATSNDAMNTYYATPTAASQQANVTALNNLYAATAAAPFDFTPYQLTAAPSFPANFTDVTITPGTHDVVFKFAMPASYVPDSNPLSAGADTTNGMIGNLASSTPQTDGTTNYWTFTYTGNNGNSGAPAWVTGTNRITLQVNHTDAASGTTFTYYKAFNITVQ